MNDYRSLRHTKWECKYHVVFIPKYRKKTIYGALRHRLGDVLRTLAEQKESRIEEGHLMGVTDGHGVPWDGAQPDRPSPVAASECASVRGEGRAPGGSEEEEAP